MQHDQIIPRWFKNGRATCNSTEHLLIRPEPKMYCCQQSWHAWQHGLTYNDGWKQCFMQQSPCIIRVMCPAASDPSCRLLCSPRWARCNECWWASQAGMHLSRAIARQQAGLESNGTAPGSTPTDNQLTMGCSIPGRVDCGQRCIFAGFARGRLDKSASRGLQPLRIKILLGSIWTK